MSARKGGRPIRWQVENLRLNEMLTVPIREANRVRAAVWHRVKRGALGEMRFATVKAGEVLLVRRIK